MSEPDRAQTAHDFALGMGVFLLTVGFVFTTLPTLTAPYEGHASDAEAASAERVAATALHYLTVDDARNRLDPARTAAFFRAHGTADALGLFFGLPPDSPVNVSILNGSRVVRTTASDGTDVSAAAGAGPTGRQPTTATRVVSVSGEPSCQPACRLVVRVW